jgi:hypothetical protein
MDDKLKEKEIKTGEVHNEAILTPPKTETVKPVDTKKKSEETKITEKGKKINLLKPLITSTENPPEEKTEKRITLKQREWLRLYMDINNETFFGNATKSALAVYYPKFPINKDPKQYSEQEKKDYHSAQTIGWENLTKLDIPIEELMDESGMSDAFLMSVLRENMKGTKLFGADAIEHPDIAGRNKAVELALRVKGKLRDRIDLTSKDKAIKSLPIDKLTDLIEKIVTEDEPKKDSDNQDPS